MKLALDALGKDERHVRRRRDGAPARLRLHAARRARARAAGRRRPSGSCSRSTARPRRAPASPPELLEAAPLVDRRRPPPRQHPLRGDQPGRRRTRPRPARSSATSCAELGVELTPEIAEAIYVALVTDTGRFQYANTTQKAHALAAELMDAGVEPAGGLPADLRVGAVRAPEAEGEGARARAAVRGRPDDRHLPAARRLRRARRGGGVRRGRDRRAPGGRRASSWR